MGQQHAIFWPIYFLTGACKSCWSKRRERPPALLVPTVPSRRYFVYEFDLIRAEELEPLDQLIEKLLEEDERKFKK